MSDTRGPLYAAAIIVAWGATLAAGLAAPLSPVSALVLVLVRTWLHTGLFIVAHDAMHGNAARRRPALNRAIGRLAAGLYAFFSYDRLLAAHRRHHATPARDGDPDYHDGRNTGFFAWFVRFMLHYVDWRPFVGYAVGFNLLEHGVGVPPERIAVVWAVPAVLSTLQLFGVGTYLPHREPVAGYGDDPHRAATLAWPAWASLAACWHFGYHREHHERPDLAWYELPAYHAVRAVAGGPVRKSTKKVENTP